MNRAAFYSLSIGLLITLAGEPAMPQRSFSTTYDSGRQIKLQGLVKRIDWVNPNAFFLMDVRDSSGTVTTWAVEFGNPIDLERDGWKSNTIHIGDQVTVDGTAARGEGRQASAKSVVL